MFCHPPPISFPSFILLLVEVVPVARRELGSPMMDVDREENSKEPELEF